MEAAKKMNLKFHIYVEESTVVPEGVRGRIEKAGGEVLTFNRKELYMLLEKLKGYE